MLMIWYMIRINVVYDLLTIWYVNDMVYGMYFYGVWYTNYLEC